MDRVSLEAPRILPALKVAADSANLAPGLLVDSLAGSGRGLGKWLSNSRSWLGISGRNEARCNGVTPGQVTPSGPGLTAPGCSHAERHARV
jgi:hypothetical protein